MMMRSHLNTLVRVRVMSDEIGVMGYGFRVMCYGFRVTGYRFRVTAFVLNPMTTAQFLFYVCSEPIVIIIRNKNCFLSQIQYHYQKEPQVSQQ